MENYLVTDFWEGDIQDVKKTVANSDDDLMCWAAAASNILVWGGWDNNGRIAEEIFEEFLQYWPDAYGYPVEAWKWWLAGDEALSDRLKDQMQQFGGGNHYPDYDFNEYIRLESDRNILLEKTEEYLQNGFGVIFELISEFHGGHEIACWGYKKDTNGNFLGVYVTDSDTSNLQTPHYYELTPEGWSRSGWYYFDYYRGGIQYLVAAVYALTPLVSRRRQRLSPPVISNISIG